MNQNDGVKSTTSRIVFMGCRSRTLHFALHFQEQFQSEILGLVPPTNIQRYNVNNKVATLTKCIFGHPPPTTFICMQNFSGGLNYSFPALRNCHRESLLITISPNKCQMRVLTRTKMRYCSIVYTFYGSSLHQFFIFDLVFCTRYPCYSDLLLTCVSEAVHKA